jgi:hypothetical protein
MRLLINCLLILPILVVTVRGADPSVSMSQLQIKRKVPADLDVHLFGDEGTKFAVLLSQPNQVIVGVDTGASRLISATDDKGTNLAKDNGNGRIGIDLYKISKTKHEIAIPISLAALPASGATAIQLKAEIALKCGSEEKTEMTTPIDFAKGAKLRFNGHALTVAVNGNDPAKPLVIKLASDEDGVWLKTFELVDEQSATIKTEDAGSESRGGIFTRYVTLNSDVKKAALRVTYYAKIENVKQPVDMKIGLSLP